MGKSVQLAPWHGKAHRFVRQNWKAIEMIARDLVEVKTLDGAEVETIIEIADGKKAAIEELLQFRVLSERKQTSQFPVKVVRASKSVGAVSPVSPGRGIYLSARRRAKR